jgi:hypothetical protein
MQLALLMLWLLEPFMQLAMPPLLLVNYICNCFVIIPHPICESDEGSGGGGGRLYRLSIGGEIRDPHTRKMRANWKVSRKL